MAADGPRLGPSPLVVTAMDARQQSLIQDTFHASGEGRLHFGEVIARLVEAGVESYAVDYRAARLTCYLPVGKALTLPQPPPAQAIATHFDAAAVRAAIAGAQRGEVMYPQFKQLTQAAGCVGYIVWIGGRHVVYYGRHGDSHVERFPD